MGAWGYEVLENDDAYEVVEQISFITKIPTNHIFLVLEGEDSEFKDSLIKQLNDKKVFYSLVKEEYIDQFIVFSIYCSLGLFNILNEIIEEVKRDKNKDPIKILMEAKIQPLYMNGWRDSSGREIYKKSIEQVFTSFYESKPFIFERKGLLEIMNESL